MTWVTISGEAGEAIEFKSGEYYKFNRIQSRQEWLERMADHLKQLHERAGYSLQKGTVYEIRSRIPSNYGRDLGVAWYSHVDMQESELIGALPYPGREEPLGGYGFMGRFRV